MTGKPELKEFHFFADCTFEAVDLDDAFAEIVRHFQALAEGETDDEHLPLTGGRIRIQPFDPEWSPDDDG